MSEQKKRFWYSAIHKGGGTIVHVISAESIEQARTYFGPVSETYVFSQLTWSDILRLTGFAPPVIEQETTWATGSLYTQWLGKVVTIEIAD